MEEELEHGVVGDGDVDLAVVVEVGDGEAEAFARGVHADLFGDLGKGTVAVVVVDEGGNGGEDIGVAVGAVAFAVLATPDVFPVPLDVAEDDQVEPAVVVEVDPGGGGGPVHARGGVAAGAGLLCDVGEGPVAVVVVQVVAAELGDVEVFEAVIVKVADGNAHAVADALEAGLLGDVFEGTVLALMVEAVPVPRAGLLGDKSLRSRVGDGRAIDEEEIKQAVVVEIEGCDAGAHRLEEVLQGGVRGNSGESDAGLLGGVGEVAGSGGRDRGCLGEGEGGSEDERGEKAGEHGRSRQGWGRV